ncbi:type II toxin-antitoxin system RelE/ParE family toxin [Intestinimonas butyriciproducens]|uniref:Addiction module RelE/StbE family toxin n=2 Tax=Intestinimonas butyriciproducens TaxID=1297617 RepID=A0A2U1BJ89_9FIRM|nr:type II toxin-antitoxin system RelE/ParE family toxin [Intestinimonas butyriciproducens]SCJ82150.1 Toxin ParE1 [uncultured Clostridium sp.]MBU5231018.1 type II toxin-antitoxin system RelE/ParE family toxin [Intestinimonas butyriciproducens]MCI6363284.1 type II toxin-antitoxin system RelE/ParE family toxin [Intestinimonas butyriciproducens]MCR1906998.1 type II toxin-antitoxin system RelE/ParE family toxin [Intestinimonas butyriciproducens]MDB7831786.1 type II toxin-antitoxin system RelE/ParE
MNNLYLSPEAQDDLSEIKAYIAEDLENPQAALSTVTKITKTIRMLQEHALIGVPLSAIADVNSDYRYLISGSYMIFYRVTGKDVFIDRVLYGRRDYLRILFGDIAEDEISQL